MNKIINKKMKTKHSGFRRGNLLILRQGGFLDVICLQTPRRLKRLKSSENNKQILMYLGYEEELITKTKVWNGLPGHPPRCYFHYFLYGEVICRAYIDKISLCEWFTLAEKS